MWSAFGNNIKMAEGDYGIQLTYAVNGATFDNADELKFTFKTAINGQIILEKTVTPDGNQIALELTEAESALLPVGTYVYSLDWYQNGQFLCNLVLAGILQVEDKA